MPHQCIRCGKEYPEGNDVMLKGCSCGARFFFYYREKPPAQIIDLKKDERKEILNEVKEAISSENENTVILDLESIQVLGPGKYEIDLVSLFKRKPVIYKQGEGRYMIDVDATFKFLRKPEK